MDRIISAAGSREAIHEAVGVLMAQHGVTPAQAVAMLVPGSSPSILRVREIVTLILEEPADELSARERSRVLRLEQTKDADADDNLPIVRFRVSNGLVADGAVAHLLDAGYDVTSPDWGPDEFMIQVRGMTEDDAAETLQLLRARDPDAIRVS
ncbi:MAG: ANTAR domain-containing protein [Acidimicrobiales bacterium]